MAAQEIEDDSLEQLQQLAQGSKNNLELHGNRTTMNLNTMILTNIQGSPYFKTQLVELKTFHEIVDEIYYKVDHLEPWERGSRKTQGITGMSGGVRGVGAGGIVSTAYCLLYKCFTLKLTRKQLRVLLNHPDSPYIRAVGFMYIRYCLPPADLWDWYEPFFDDEEELDVKAGGGCKMTIGEMLIQWLTKLDWYGTLFPRIPVPIQKQLEQSLRERRVMLDETERRETEDSNGARRVIEDNAYSDSARNAASDRISDRWNSDRERGSGSGSYGDRERRSSDNHERDRHHHRSSHHYDREYRRHRERDRSRSRDGQHIRESSFERDLRRERERHRH